ncbi:MAG TPA: LuxR C-terminal-related transcriptional regulator [Marmoricola sp.]|nr:LuxR C-terminal-related transcriptional regulator [Marmoricola sp.]
MSTPVLATKLFAPTRRPQAVARPRLVERLDAGLAAGARLTLVSAPPGFGKTTLTTEWLGRRDHRRVGWVSLDEGDNDLARFLTHLVAALRNAGLPVDTGLVDVLHAASTSAALTALVNDVAEAGDAAPGERWILVLDDFHAVEAADVHEAMTFLLDHLPDQLHLLVATRSDPPLPLSRLRSRGQLTEVRAADLRFTAAEARELLNDAMGLELGPADVDALEERTEGWVAGLQLAALSLRGLAAREDVAGFIESFAGSNRFVIDYLADEVLARQPAPLRDFLLRTAVLDQLTGPLCDAVTGRSDGVAVLQELERTNVFLVPLDDRRLWYRYHHLFADVLRARLLTEHGDLLPRLHRAASTWYAVRGSATDAVRHALAAEEFHRAAYLMEEALPELRRTRQDALLMTWVRSLPEAVVRRSPVLSIVAAWSLLMTGDLEGLESRLDDAESALAAGAQDDSLAASWADTEDLRTAPAAISVYRASLAQARGDVAGTVRHARHVLELAGPEDHFLHGAGGGFLGLAAWAAGDVREALATFGTAVRSLHAAGNLVDELDATVVLADMWVAAGRPSRARRLCDEALQRAIRGGEPYPRATADLHTGLAELDRELGDLPGAEAHLETARGLRERASITENRHRWFVAMAQVRAATGHHDLAARLLDQAEDLYRPGFYPDLRPIAAMRARLQVALGDLEAAQAWADERGVRVDDEPDYLREFEQLTVVRLLLAQQRAAGLPRSATTLDQVLETLDRLESAAADHGREGSVLELRLLRALVQDARGDRTRALAALERALVGAPEPESHVRLFLDEGEPMLALLRHATGAGDPLAGHARRLLERAEPPVGRAGAQAVLPDPMSRRELEVLRLLDSELTGPEIARELYVSLNTLRTHTKRIFTKLDVGTRAAAVHRARESGLL